MAGNGHSVPVAGAYFDDPVLGHQHRGFDIALYFGPFDAQVISAINSCSIGADDWGRGRYDGEEAGKVYLP